MKYIILLFVLLFSCCDNPNGELSKDFTAQLKEMQRRLDKAERNIKTNELEWYFVKNKKELAELCKEYLKLDGNKSVQEGKDYNIWINYFTEKIECVIYIKRYDNNGDFLDLDDLNRKIKDLKLEAYDKEHNK